MENKSINELEVKVGGGDKIVRAPTPSPKTGLISKIIGLDKNIAAFTTDAVDKVIPAIVKGGEQILESEALTLRMQQVSVLINDLIENFAAVNEKTADAIILKFMAEAKVSCVNTLSGIADQWEIYLTEHDPEAALFLEAKLDSAETRLSKASQEWGTLIKYSKVQFLKTTDEMFDQAAEKARAALQHADALLAANIKTAETSANNVVDKMKNHVDDTVEDVEKKTKRTLRQAIVDLTKSTKEMGHNFVTGAKDAIMGRPKEMYDAFGNKIHNAAGVVREKFTPLVPQLSFGPAIEGGVSLQRFLWFLASLLLFPILICVGYFVITQRKKEKPLLETKAKKTRVLSFIFAILKIMQIGPLVLHLVATLAPQPYRARIKQTAMNTWQMLVSASIIFSGVMELDNLTNPLEAYNPDHAIEDSTKIQKLCRLASDTHAKLDTGLANSDDIAKTFKNLHDFLVNPRESDKVFPAFFIDVLTLMQNKTHLSDLFKIDDLEDLDIKVTKKRRNKKGEEYTFEEEKYTDKQKDQIAARRYRLFQEYVVMAYFFYVLQDQMSTTPDLILSAMKTYVQRLRREMKESSWAPLGNVKADMNLGPLHIGKEHRLMTSENECTAEAFIIAHYEEMLTAAEQYVELVPYMGKYTIGLPAIWQIKANIADHWQDPIFWYNLILPFVLVIVCGSYLAYVLGKLALPKLVVWWSNIRGSVKNLMDKPKMGMISWPYGNLANSNLKLPKPIVPGDWAYGVEELETTEIPPFKGKIRQRYAISDPDIFDIYRFDNGQFKKRVFTAGAELGVGNWRLINRNNSDVVDLTIAGLESSDDVSVPVDNPVVKLRSIHRRLLAFTKTNRLLRKEQLDKIQATIEDLKLHYADDFQKDPKLMAVANQCNAAVYQLRKTAANAQPVVRRPKPTARSIESDVADIMILEAFEGLSDSEDYESNDQPTYGAQPDFTMPPIRIDAPKKNPGLTIQPVVKQVKMFATEGAFQSVEMTEGNLLLQAATGSARFEIPMARVSKQLHFFNEENKPTTNGYQFPFGLVTNKHGSPAYVSVAGRNDRFDISQVPRVDIPDTELTLLPTLVPGMKETITIGKDLAMVAPGDDVCLINLTREGILVNAPGQVTRADENGLYGIQTAVTSDTKPGDCGGGYFNKAGKLVGLHFSRGTKGVDNLLVPFAPAVLNFLKVQKNCPPQ